MSKVSVEEAYAAAHKFVKPWIIAFMCSMFLNLVFGMMIHNMRTSSESYVDAAEISASGFSSVAKVKE